MLAAGRALHMSGEVPERHMHVRGLVLGVPYPVACRLDCSCEAECVSKALFHTSPPVLTLVFTRKGRRNHQKGQMKPK